MASWERNFVGYKNGQLVLCGCLLYQITNMCYVGMRLMWLLPLVYISVFLVILGLAINHDNLRKTDSFIYWVLLLDIAYSWARYDSNGYNGGIFQDITGMASSFFFLVYFCKSNVFKLRYLFAFQLTLAFLGLVYAWMNRNVILNTYDILTGNAERYTEIAMASIYCLVNCAFILLVYRAASTFQICLAAVSVLGALVIALTCGRRGYAVLLALFILESLCLFLLFDKRHSLMLRGCIIAVTITLFLVLFQAGAEWQFAKFFQRLDTDSRSLLFESWNDAMGGDLHSWIFGKGISGGYYDYALELFRPNIENGVRNTILKGGLLYFVTYALISLHASYLAFFRANSMIMRGLAMYALTLLGFMFVWGTPSLSFLHLNLWISYTWMFDPNLRRLRDEQLLCAIK